MWSTVGHRDHWEISGFPGWARSVVWALHPWQKQHGRKGQLEGGWEPPGVTGESTGSSQQPDLGVGTLCSRLDRALHGPTRPCPSRPGCYFTHGERWGLISKYIKQGRRPATAIAPAPSLCSPHQGQGRGGAAQAPQPPCPHHVAKLRAAAGGAQQPISKTDGLQLRTHQPLIKCTCLPHRGASGGPTLPPGFRFHLCENALRRKRPPGPLPWGGLDA